MIAEPYIRLSLRTVSPPRLYRIIGKAGRPVKPAVRDGYEVWIRRSDGSRIRPADCDRSFVQRGGVPADIASAADGPHNPSSIVVRRGRRPPWELLNGILFKGRSTAFHEIDVALEPAGSPTSGRPARIPECGHADRPALKPGYVGTGNWMPCRSVPSSPYSRSKQPDRRTPPCSGASQLRKVASILEPHPRSHARRAMVLVWVDTRGGPVEKAEWMPVETLDGLQGQCPSRHGTCLPSCASWRGTHGRSAASLAKLGASIRV